VKPTQVVRIAAVLVGVLVAAALGRVLIWADSGVAWFGFAALFGIGWAAVWPRLWFAAPFVGASLSGVELARNMIAGGNIWPIAMQILLMWMGTVFLAGLATWFAIEWSRSRGGRRTSG
jgi:hypothetical protein